MSPSEVTMELEVWMFRVWEVVKLTLFIVMLVKIFQIYLMGAALNLKKTATYLIFLS